MDPLQPGLLADRPHPPISGARVETVAVVAQQDRSLYPFADRQIQRSGSARDERDPGGPVAFADNLQRAMPAFEAEVLDVGPARFADPQPVQAEQHRQGGVHRRRPLGGEEERGQLATVHTSLRRRVHRGRRTYWAGLVAMRPSMWAKR